MPRGRGGRHGGGPQPRSVLVSKALSRLLRHAAVEERIPIDNHGYVRMDHLLGWQRLRSMKPSVSLEEVVDVVQENEKKRFALKFVQPGSEVDSQKGEGKEKAIEAASTMPESESEAQQESDTQRTITIFQSTSSASLDTKRFFIRATQGHSMKTIEAENLLTPITLEDAASVPETVVHGTFYGAWDGILKTGGLKSMRRNHVHCATGPSLHEVLPSATSLGEKYESTNGATEKNDSDNSNGKQQGSATNVGSLLGKNKVISGMRSDAQILIYIDIRKALSEEKDMKWWRSENGVILTDGVVPPSSSGDQVDGKDAATEEKIMQTKYFLAAVEIKEGVGLLWEAEKGVVKELPERLRGRGVPRGKGGGPRGRGQQRGK